MNVQLLQEHGILWGGGGNWQAWVDEWDALEELKRKGQDKATLALIGTVQVGGCKQAPYLQFLELRCSLRLPGTI